MVLRMGNRSLAAMALLVGAISLAWLAFRPPSSIDSGDANDDPPSRAPGEESIENSPSQLLNAFSNDPQLPSVLKLADAMFSVPGGMTYQLKNYQGQFDGWVQLMRSGDLNAARALWKASLACSQRGFAPYSRESFDDLNREELDRAKQSGEEPDKSVLLRNAVLYSRCGNITERQRAVALEALKVLAESGDWDARRDFITLGRPDVQGRSLNTGNRLLHEHRKQANDYLSEGIASGKVEALLLASALHGPQDYTGPQSLVAADPVKVLAHQLAATRVLELQLRRLPQGPSEDRDRIQAQIEQLEQDAAVLSLMGDPSKPAMTDAQVREAGTIAEELIKACCS